MYYNCFVIDLHIHSNYSDGTCSVEEILEIAKSLGLKQIAITDHNILNGSIKASEIADIDFVIGSELTVDYNGTEVHLLAYFPYPSDYKNTQFIINSGQINKKIAIMETIENLNAMGFDLDILEVSKYAKGIVNRVHICMAMKDKGYISSISEGFEKYVGDDCEAYVKSKRTSLFEAIEAVHRDGGLAVVAHPYEYDVNIDQFFNEIIGKIDGIECFHPSANASQSKHLVDIAERYNKIITGGSDFHGDNKPDIVIDMMSVDEKYRINRN